MHSEGMYCELVGGWVRGEEGVGVQGGKESWREREGGK